MPGASYPKPDGQKVTRHPLTVGWTVLPAQGRTEPAPRLPGWREWSPETLLWWSELWATPQATQWAQDGSSLVLLACLIDDVICGRKDSDRVSAEVRQHRSEHGLSPKAMLQLRWRIEDADVVVESPTLNAGIPKRLDRRKASALRVLAGGGS